MAARSARWYSEAAETTPVLKKLTVERFKSIRHAEVELGRVNLFIGGNGAGKSNILEAIGVLSASAYRGVGDTDLSSKGVRITPPELMKSAFKNHPLPRTLQLTAELEGDVTYRINLTGKEDAPLLAFFSESCTQGAEKIFGRGPNGVQVRGTSVRRNLDRHRSLWDQVRAAFDFPVAVDTALRGLAQYAIYAPQTDFLRGMAAGKLDTPPIGLHGEGLPHAVRGLLEQWEEAKRQELPAFQLKDRATDLPFLPGWARVVRVGRIDSALTSRALLDQGDDMVYFLDQYQVTNSPCPIQRGNEIRMIIENAGDFNQLSQDESKRHIPAPAVESTEAWCVAVYGRFPGDPEQLKGPDLCEEFMRALHLSEDRALQPFRQIDKNPDRRRRYCERHADGFRRVETQCHHYRELVESVTSEAESI